ncbi:MAG: SOS response-associated peptidase [Phycisphaerales bacterium]
MCGRYTHLYTWRELFRLMNLTAGVPEVGVHPSWNVAPTQSAPVVVEDQGVRRVQMMRWGFSPPWATASSVHPINAKCETVASSPMFRESFRHRRCLVPASGFYEWKAGIKEKAPKQPYYITLRDEPVMCFAGLWTPGAGEEPATFTVLTTTPNELMAGIHTRMPVIVDGAHRDAWLGQGQLGMDDPWWCAPLPAGRMQTTTVGTRVNSPRNNDASLIEHRPAERTSLFDL